MKNLMLVPVLSLLFTFTAHAQAYMTAGGLRAGTDWGLTIQQRLTKNMTFEGIAQSSLQREEVLLTGLVERHYALLFRGLNLYTGAGVHKGFLNNSSNPETGTTDFKDPLGVTFVGGAELTLGRFNISYDFKPAINLMGGERTFYTQTGISVRYVLLTNKHFKKIQKKKRKQKRKEKIRDWQFWKKKN